MKYPFNTTQQFYTWLLVIPEWGIAHQARLRDMVHGLLKDVSADSRIYREACTLSLSFRVICLWGDTLFDHLRILGFIAWVSQKATSAFSSTRPRPIR